MKVMRYFEVLLAKIKKKFIIIHIICKKIVSKKGFRTK